MNLDLQLDQAVDVQSLTVLLRQALLNVPEILWFDVQFGAAFEPLSVYHKLGQVPKAFIENVRIDGLVYAELDDLRQWSDQRIVVRCNAENARVNLGIVV